MQYVSDACCLVVGGVGLSPTSACLLQHFSLRQNAKHNGDW